MKFKKCMYATLCLTMLGISSKNFGSLKKFNMPNGFKFKGSFECKSVRNEFLEIISFFNNILERQNIPLSRTGFRSTLSEIKWNRVTKSVQLIALKYMNRLCSAREVNSHCYIEVIRSLMCNRKFEKIDLDNDSYTACGENTCAVLLYNGVKKRNISFVKILLSFGISPNIRFCRDPVFFNAKTVSMAELLYDNGVNIYENKDNTDTIIHHILHKSWFSEKLLKFYISHGVKINQNGFGGFTPLQNLLFFWSGNKEKFKELFILLLKLGADVNVPVDCKGDIWHGHTIKLMAQQMSKDPYFSNKDQCKGRIALKILSELKKNEVLKNSKL